MSFRIRFRSIALFGRGTVALAALVSGASLAAAVPTITLPVHLPGTTSTAPNKGSSQPQLSDDGRYLTFVSNSTDLIAGFTDNNEGSQSGGASDIFQKDLQTGVITLVSHKAGSTTAGANSRFTGQPRASADGRFIFFASDATDLVTGKGGVQRAYLWDRTTGTNAFIADAQVGGSTISADGNWLLLYTPTTMPRNVFDSALGTFSAPPGASFNLYMIQRTTGAVTLVSHAAGNATLPTSSSVQSMAVSSDGRYVAFETGGFIAGWDTVTNTYAGEAAYLYDWQTDTFTLITKRNDGSAPITTGQTLNSPAPLYMSPDGRYVFFNVVNTDVDFGTASPDNNGVSDLYRFDRDGGTAKLARFYHDVYPFAANGFVGTPHFSPNGRYMAFISAATNLVAGDTNGRNDIFRLDTTTSTIDRVNVTSTGAQWTDASNGITPTTTTLFTVAAPRVNDAGNVIFNSTAIGLGFTDTNGATDIMLATFGAAAVAPTVATPTSASIATTTATLGGNITADGGASVTERGIVYAVTATNSNPQIGGSGATKVAASGTSTGTFTTSVTGLTASTAYTFKAYATNSAGTGYSSTGTFTTTAADSTPPTIVSIVRQSPTSQTIGDGTTSFTFRVTYSEAVTGVGTSSFEVEPRNGGTIAGSVANVSGSGTTRDATVTLTGGHGEFRLKPVD